MWIPNVAAHVHKTEQESSMQTVDETDELLIFAKFLGRLLSYGYSVNWQLLAGTRQIMQLKIKTSDK